jgi:hypothetical protein
MTAGKLLSMSVFAATLLSAGGNGGRAEYVGGTISRIPSGCHGTVQAIDQDYFVFTAGKAHWRVPYQQINTLEYGQHVERDFVNALLLSPLFLLRKKHQYFLTVGYADDDGKQQALIFKVDGGDIRAMLVSLEARTGRKVEYQDEDARKGGKG